MGCLREKTRTGASFMPGWLFDFVIEPKQTLIEFDKVRWSNLAYIWLQTGRYTGKLTRDEKTDLPNVKGEVKRAVKTTFAHLCTPLTRDKCLPLPTVSGESSGDKGSFCHVFNPYLWRASKVYLISIVKYVWDSRQRCGKKRGEVIMYEIKVKGLPKVWSNGVHLKLRSKLWQRCRQIWLEFKSKV